MTENFYEHLFGVRDKVALVTGGTRGIGLMIAEGLVRCGADVYISSRKTDACAQAEATLSRYGRCTAIPGDVGHVAGCRKLAAEIAQRSDKLHILVNNAGLTWGADIDEFPEKAWDKVMNLDAKGPFFLTQALLPQLRAAASPEVRASIVNVSSTNAIRPSGLQNYSYVAAKAGLQGLSTQMARDLNSDNINVNVLAPGPFKSKMTAPLYANADIEKQVVEGFTMGRWGAMEDAAGLTVFLSSKAGTFLTGVVIPCDGGATTIG
ncbi:MAG: SDR family oxidoreductase [Pseudomonadales bacterium]|nr:SDR family oxidoreductase [Pseudomonadales bacterium]MDP6471215.1 SDR family oxidoreductase [Pseudomonadales bacterium]MDP6825596.1 SDR family oxidoreductase [Pseudomonadales bacterium]MDP6972963.1 SDR family oxidoreductase [Pseudomonadales bacterium]